MTTALALSQGEHRREVGALQDQFSQMVEVTTYNKLNTKLVDAQKTVRELETALEQRAAETSKMLIGQYYQNIG